MRIRPWHTLIFIIVLFVSSLWVVLPTGSAPDPFGWHDSIKVHEGLDLQGGLQVVLEARPPSGTSIDADALNGTRNTIEKRVNALGVSEPLVQTRGNDQIIVELPGIDDPEAAISVLQETALLEIVDVGGQSVVPGQLITTTLGGPEDLDNPEASPEASPVGSPTGATPIVAISAVGTPEVALVGSPGASPVGSPEASPVAVDEEVAPTGPVFTTIISGKDLKDAYPTQGQFGSTVVGFELKGDAAGIFFEFTSTNLGQQMAIVLDKRVISAPVINGAISDQGIIEGMTAVEVNDLVIQLKAGALAVPLEVVQSRTVGPTLGQDSLDKSLIAGIVGLGIVALFMILYYRLPGILSVFALIIYTLLVFALFKLIPVTLTLAGIAGFILSIGMAVDANVLIFARMKEEIRLGKSRKSAVEAGFDHAWPSIRDSNISSMITAGILYWFGQYTGASIITGFALTLFIGVAVSMFTAITVTRTFLRLLMAAGLAKNSWWYGVDADRPEAVTGTAD